MKIKIMSIPREDSLRPSSAFLPFEAKHRSIDCYYIEIDRELSNDQCRLLSSSLVREMTNQSLVIANSKIIQGDLSFFMEKECIMEASYLPGVNDNVANVVLEITSSLLGIDRHNTRTSSSSIYAFDKLPIEYKDLIVRSVCNDIVQTITIEPGSKFCGRALSEQQSRPNHPYKPGATYVNMNASENELSLIATLGILEESTKIRRGALNLSMEDMLAIRDHFNAIGRLPTDIELEALAQGWSEHCKHRIFNSPIDEIADGLFNHYIRGATNKIMDDKRDFCVSVFSDNSGAITFDDSNLVTHKVETHNSPSALDPYGGAMTGILGVNRDCLGFGMAARPIANTYAFCFARHNGSPLYRDEGRTRPALDAEKIINDVVSGIEVGGNCSGIPTPHGLIYYDNCYRGKPLVYAGTIGLIPRTVNGRPSHITGARAGDLIVMLGNRVGRDGIHGATLSSGICDDRSNVSMVQIGNPYLQKKLCDATLEMRPFFNAITDNGAGGLSSSVGEMGYRGFVVDIEKIPLKNYGMAPWEIWISESQERMTLAVPASNIDAIKAIADDHDVEISIIGEFNDSAMAVVRHSGKTIMEISTDFLANGYHKQHLYSEEPAMAAVKHITPDSEDVAGDMLQLLASCNVCSRACVAHRYDHEVQGTAILKPIINDICTDASVIRPILSSEKGLAISSSLSPIFWSSSTDLIYHDTYNTAACAIDATMRNLVSVGADPDAIALLDNFCWRDPYDPRSLWQLKRAAQACHDYATAYGAPFISGKDSMFNDFAGYNDNGNIHISIKPTLLISGISVMDSISHIVSIDFKQAGSNIYMAGITRDEVCGCSEYARLKSIEDTRVPGVDARTALELYRKFFTAAKNGLIASAIPLNIGGLGVACAKSVLSGSLGCVIDLGAVQYDANAKKTDTSILFSETPSRILLSVHPCHEDELKTIFSGVPFAKIGVINDDSCITIIRCTGQRSAVTIDSAREAYQSNTTGII